MLMESWLRSVRSRLFGCRRLRRGTKRQRPVMQTATAAETFEIRQYPAATMMATLKAGGELYIEGTTKADAVTVQQTGDQLAVRNGTAVLQIKVGTAGVNQVSAAQVQFITINSLAGTDTIRLEGVSIAAKINGGDGIDNITGGNGNDTLTGGLGNDILNGGGGVNTLVESGNVSFTLTNTRLTGNGTDTLSNITLARLTGGNGNNTLNASAFSGSVTLDGANGNDTLFGGGTSDVLIGGLGNDKLIGNAGADQLRGGDGNDTLEGGGGNDTLEGAVGNDSLNGGADDDHFVFSGLVALGLDTFVTGDNLGTNTLDFSGLTVAIARLDLGQTTSQTVNSKLSLTLRSVDAIDIVIGTNSSDLIFGNTLSNRIEGRDGNDTVGGNAGHDTLLGGSGDDSLDGHAGDDVIEGNAGADSLFGGTGTNQLDGGEGLDSINGTPEIVAFAWDQILSTYNTGRIDALSVAQFIIDNGFGQDLPVLQESVGEILDAVTKLQSAFDKALTGTQQQIEAARLDLAALGFTIEYMGSRADANRDLLRITYHRTFNTDRARLNVGGETGFAYFDNDVNGTLSGSFVADSPTVTVHLTFGVDEVGGTAQQLGTPTFFISDSSYVAFDDLHASGHITGEMAIRYLANVKAEGTLTVDLDGRLNLRDSDADHKIRLSDLSNGANVVGDVDGSVVLNVDMNTNVSVIQDMKWHGDWRAEVIDGVVQEGQVNLQLPSAEAVFSSVLSSFVDMKNSFDFLGPIGEVLNFELPFLGSLGEAAGVGEELGWLTSQVGEVRETLRDYGVEFAEFDTGTLTKLISGERVDLIWFQASDSGILWDFDQSFLFAAAPIGPFVVSLSGVIRAEIGWDWSVGFGVDTTGVWIDSGTHLGLYGSARAGVQGSLSVAGLLGVTLEAGLGVQINAGLGLRDPDPSDGHIYMDEIFDGRPLLDAIGNVMKFEINASAIGYARGELNLPWPLPDVTLFDVSFKVGGISDSERDAVTQNTHRKFALAGQGEKDPLGVMQGETLVITGTADRDAVTLSKQDGRVTLKAPGYRRGEYVGVRKVVFLGGDGDDQLLVQPEFDIPIEADGGAGHDTLSGGTANDTLRGGEGNDQLQGQSGHDALHGENGNDLINGGSGNDLIRGGEGYDLLQGGADHDDLDGQGGNDGVEGGSGNDMLKGSDGDDLLNGGSGDDVLDGEAGEDVLSGEDGNDLLNAGSGNDVLLGGAENDTLQGGVGDDSLMGDGGHDSLLGDDGADTILGGDGNDYANGGKGNDFLFGQAGNDELHGSLRTNNVIDADDQDYVHGGADSDIVQGGRGDDSLNGGEGADVIGESSWYDSVTRTWIAGEPGQDTIIIELTPGTQLVEDVLQGGTDRDTLWISPMRVANHTDNELHQLTDVVSQHILNSTQQEQAANQVPFNAAELEQLSELGSTVRSAVESGTGDNKISLTQLDANHFRVEQFELFYSETGEPETGELLATMQFELSGGTDTDIENITIAGLDGNDFLNVSSNVTRDLILDGGDGNDTLLGGSGRDVLRGGVGDDSLAGNSNSNNDELHGGIGNDTLEGGDDTDRLYGGNGNDQLNGGDGHDYQVGGDGDDLIEAGSGIAGDVIDGGAGYDTLIGGAGVDFIRGGDESGPKDPNDPNSPQGDLIDGRGMGDFLDGNGGNDSITGGSGADIIFGGDGNDFVIAGTSEAETLRAASDWLAEELHVRDELVRLNSEILAKTNEVETLRAIPVGQRTDDENLALAQLAQEELDLRNLEDQLSEVKRELNRERGAFLVEELQKAGIELNYQAIFQDMVVGGEGNDTLKGSAFQDLLIGGAGDDEFRHSSGRDQIIGGDGVKDTYLLDGTNFDDTIAINGVQDGTSNLAFDVNLITNAVLMTSRISLDPDIEVIGVRGLGGNDTMTANFGRNALKDVRFEGGNGNDSIDVLSLESKATLVGGSGDDTLIGGLSDDLLIGGVLDVNDEPVESNSGNDSLSGGDGRDTLYGCDGNDTLRGGAENDSLLGGNGYDTVYGDAGDDRIFGGDDVDNLYGGADNDTLYGGEGGDNMYGEVGSDDMNGDAGVDNMYGGIGNDIMRGGADGDHMFGEEGNDQVNGQEGNDEVQGGDGDDSLYGREDNDFIQGGAGSDYIDAFDGNDDVYGDDNHNSHGSSDGADYILGGKGNDIIAGGFGNDTIYGEGGNDILFGNDGDDLVSGHLGTDQVYGQAGNDYVDGGPSGEGDHVEQ